MQKFTDCMVSRSIIAIFVKKCAIIVKTPLMKGAPSMTPVGIGICVAIGIGVIALIVSRVMPQKGNTETAEQNDQAE